MTNKKTRVGIIGAGISGLSTAYALQKKGITSSVYEQSDEVGGVIQSVHKNGWLVEEGPHTLMIKSQAIWDLLEELDLKKSIIEANDSVKKRYVVKNNKPIPLPLSLTSFLKTSLLTVTAKLRLLKEPFISASHLNDESIASFIQRRLGRQLLDYAINPFVSGIYAGDPERLSIKHTFSTLWDLEQKYGSISRGLLKKDKTKKASRRTLISFPQGLQMLPRTLAKSLHEPVQTSTEIISAKRKNNQWVIKGSKSDQSFTMEHDCLITTVPAYALPNIFGPDHFDQISVLPYVPLSVLTLGFKEGQIDHPLDGFGMLIPEVEQYNTLGLLFSTTLFSDRAPKEHQQLSCFIGGARNREIAAKSKKELLSIVLKELDDLLGVSGKPVFSHHRYWPHAIPQYHVGYDRYLSLIKELERKEPGLYLEGNFKNGVSLPHCISSGFETAHKVHALLQPD